MLRTLLGVVVGMGAVVGVAGAQQPAPPPTGVQQACAADYQAFCAGVQPGGGRIKACFRQNAAKLSAGCKEALKGAKAGRSEATPGG